jgi:hypothetical protein
VRKYAVLGRLVVLLIAVACLALTANPAVASPPDPSGLPVGAAPAVMWQSGTTVHLPSGKSVRLPLGKPGTTYDVLGKRHGEWIVLTPRLHARVLAVRGARVRTVWDHSDPEAYTSYVLSDGGSLVAQFTYDRSGRSEAVVFDLAGKVMARKRWSTYVNLLDFAGNTLLVGDHATTSTWTVPGKPVPVAGGAAYGDLRGDLLFAYAGTSDSLGPTSISSPVASTWTALDFQPAELSPDRQYIAGMNFDVKDVLEVRKVSDGTVLPLPPYKLASGLAMTWQPDGSLLFLVERANKQALVRCTVTGVCDRATRWVRDKHVGFPD